MRDKRPTVCSVFTGAGGLDIGLELAGFRTVAAVECDEDCVTTLQANKAAIPIPNGDGHRFLEGTQIVAKKIQDVERHDLWPE